MHFGFALELPDIDLWNTDLLDTHLDLLSRDKYTDIPIKHIACLHRIFKRSSRYVFKTSSRHAFKTSSRPTNVCWVVHNKRCVLPTSRWMDTILESKYSPKSCLLSVLHENEVKKLRGKGASWVICNTRVPDKPYPLLVCAFKLFLK